MGRKAIIIDKNKMQECIRALETNEKFTGHSTLFARVAASFGVSPAFIVQKVKLWGLVITTSKGKRGRSDIHKSAPHTGRRTKRSIQVSYQQAVRQEFAGAGLDKRVEGACAGSLKSAIALKCFDCCAGERDEVRHCEIVACPLWAYRPWRVRQK